MTTGQTQCPEILTYVVIGIGGEVICVCLTQPPQHEYISRIGMMKVKSQL